jgi:hypothetical protein
MTLAGIEPTIPGSERDQTHNQTARPLGSEKTGFKRRTFGCKREDGEEAREDCIMKNFLIWGVRDVHRGWDGRTTLQKLYSTKLKGRDNVTDIDVDGIIILN